MKWNASTAAFLLSCLAVAIPIDAAGVAEPEAMIEVTVWVDEHGQTLSVETMQPTATVGNVSVFYAAPNRELTDRYRLPLPFLLSPQSQP